MNRKLFSRIVAIILALIMIGSVFAVALQAFAVGQMPMMIANTGDSNLKNTIIIVAVVAFVILVALVIVPSILKKKR